MEQIKLSEKAERALILSQLNENSAMIIDLDDVALILNCGYDYVQSKISKKPGFPEPVQGINGKSVLFKSQCKALTGNQFFSKVAMLSVGSTVKHEHAKINPANERLLPYLGRSKC
ncbi:TPA: hypothetical protein PXA70_001505 [Mannheimia haemolytica]|nr:hypothetical protein [Mannheimia haemolytica]HDL5118334.1 hypothetical protein [Mannheimia haemolytica]HDL5213444.1 hypothetical protein [Mannheimia haemolytica]HDL5264568.1 hypothetical protein [Mannheimia haemolytica]HDL5459509.1 hypothetical protein [Mannheimia haemolytica]